MRTVQFDDLEGLRSALPAAVGRLTVPCEVASGGPEVQFGRRLEAGRRSVGISRQELARRPGVSAALIARFESKANNANPSLWQIAAIASVLGLSVTSLLGVADDPSDLRDRVLAFAADRGRSAADVVGVLSLAARGATEATMDDAAMQNLFDLATSPAPQAAQP